MAYLVDRDGGPRMDAQSEIGEAGLLSAALDRVGPVIRLDDVEIPEQQRPYEMTDAPVIYSASLRQNLCLGKSFSDVQLVDALTAVELHQEFIETGLYLDTPIGTGARGLSGGQVQRLEVARLLLHGVKHATAEEPLHAISQHQRQRLLETCEGRGLRVTSPLVGREHL